MVMLRRLALGMVLVAGIGLPHAAVAGSAQSAQRAAAALVRGDTAGAAAEYSEALKDTRLTNDRRATILNDRAVAFARLGQTKLALDDFNEAATLFPEYAAIYNNRGSLLLALGYPEEAIKDFNRAIVLAPGYAAALGNRAGAYSQVGHSDQAIRDYTRAIKLMPQAAAPLAGRGRVHLTVGRPHAAIRDFTRAVSADPRFAAAYRNRAEAKLEISHNEDAVEDLSRAIAFDADNAELYLLRGQAYMATRKLGSALKDFTKVVELDPNSAPGYAARGLASGLDESFEKAFSDLNRAIELDPRSATGFANRAFVYKLSGQPDVGVRDAETALKLDEDGPEALWAKGEIEEAQGLRDEALASFRRAVELKPDLKLAADGLQRLGGDIGDEGDKEIAGLGIEDWRVVERGGRYYAVSDKYRRVRVPLEMTGEGQPRLLEFEIKPPPLSGIATLRFNSGSVPGRMGPEEFEQVAILDLETKTVIAIEPHRQGKKVADWTWQNDRVVIASVDGATDEFFLRTRRERPRGYDRYASDGAGAWAPWGQPEQERRPRRRKKQKSLFQLLFGN
jgi:tetratricopeptide (TPR) repeat protein